MSALSPDRAAIEDFLVQVGGDAIQLVTFPATGGPSQARWFGADAAGAAAWAEQRNAAGANVYYSANVVRSGLNKKASKEDVTAIRYAQVDIDPPKEKGSTFDKTAAVSMLRGAEVPPHVVVDSGGGVQALWRVDGLDAPAVEAINRLLIAQFGGDPACSDSSRILRVPGTINLPNEKKRNAGRVPAAATLLGTRAGRTTATELTAAYGATPTPDRADRAALAGGLTSLDALGIGAADPLRQLLADPAGDDRSADTYAAACDMHRRGFDADQIAAVLLDPELPISAHCLAQANPERAAHRAVERAQAAVEADGDGFEALADAHRAAAAISAIPFGWPAAHTIPQRRWLYGRQLQRGNVGAIVAPGATGKTALTVGMALAMASGRPLLGHEVHGGPKRVWLWNLEDAREELNRSIIAAAMYHSVAPADATGLFVNSGLTDESLCTAVATRQGFTVLQPVYKALAAEIMARRIDCLIVDPFVSSHAVNENDNGAIDAVAKEWAKVAAAADCVIVLVHHTSKAAGAEVTVDRARGASALTNAARSVTVLNRMTDDEFNRYGLGLNAEPGDAGGARRYFRTFDDKANRAPAADGSDWYRMESVDLPNGEGDDWIGDSVGVATRYYPPAAGAAELLAPTMAADVQTLIAQGEWREDVQGKPWVGEAIAQVLGLDADDKTHRVRIKAVLKDLLADGTLAREERKDAARRPKWWIVVGPAAAPQLAKSASSPGALSAPPCASPQNSGGAVEHDGSLAVLRSTLTPLGVGGVEQSSAASAIGSKRGGAKAAAPGQNSAVPVATDGSELSIGVQKGPPIGVQKGPPSSCSVTVMAGVPFALVAA